LLEDFETPVPDVRDILTAHTELCWKRISLQVELVEKSFEKKFELRKHLELVHQLNDRVELFEAVY